jgi:protein-S-isoprenylcysteine O-methyltransferase Ste14
VYKNGSGIFFFPPFLILNNLTGQMVGVETRNLRHNEVGLFAYRRVVMVEREFSRVELNRLVYPKFLAALVVLPLIFMLPAGTWRYWQAWVYTLILLTPMFFLMQHMIKNQPALLIRRMQFREKAQTQKTIVTLSYIPILLAFVLPGFDHRFAWSAVPVWLVILSDVLVVLGYGMTIWVFRENQYASRIVEVAQEQQVISTGPYAVVRHPMYVGVLVMYVFSPLALGSYWAVIPALFIVPVLAIRAVDEEKMLSKDLPGYEEYKSKTRYRLIPGVW